MGCFHLNPSSPILAEQAEAGWQHWGGGTKVRGEMEKIARARERGRKGGRGKRFIVFKPEIERTRWKQRRRKEGREKGIEKGRIRKGKWFSRRGDLQSGEERAAKNEIGGRREGGRQEEVVTRAGVQEELERSEE